MPSDDVTTFWRADRDECPDCGSEEVYTDGMAIWCSECGWPPSQDGLSDGDSA